MKKDEGIFKLFDGRIVLIGMEKNYPDWMSTCLRLAAIYNILWGAWVVIWPQAFSNGREWLPCSIRRFGKGPV
jgi:hypothetical protein